MKKCILSLDYDACYSILTPEGYDAEVERTNYEFWHDGSHDPDTILNAIRSKFNDYLTLITESSDAISVYVGSDRQSHTLDELNQKKNNHNGSVFTALETLCKARTTEAKPWIFEKLLLADPLMRDGGAYERERGLAYRQMKNRDALQFELKEKRNPNSKYDLILNQMWDSYRENPGAEALEFHFIDDRKDLIDDLISRMDPTKMPPNMTLMVSRFDYISHVEAWPRPMMICLDSRTPIRAGTRLPRSPILDAVLEVGIEVSATLAVAPHPLPSSTIIRSESERLVIPVASTGGGGGGGGGGDGEEFMKILPVLPIPASSETPLYGGISQVHFFTELERVRMRHEEHSGVPMREAKIQRRI